jgi:tetratricopeptide (TPR) repeat protein
VALALSDVGAALITAGRAAEAIACLQEAAQLMVGAQDPFNEARISTRLGQAQVHDGQLDDAAANLRRALSVLREIGSLPGQADALESLGELAERSMRPGDARREYEAALAILTRLGAARATRIRARLKRLDDLGLA